MLKTSELTGGGKRIEFIDLAKGVCIILIVLQHTFHPYPPFLHMLSLPLFFVLSGLFFREYGGYVRLLVKKVNTLLIPFIFFYLGSYLMLDALQLLLHGSVPTEGGGLLDVFRIRLFHNNPLWFLLALFWQHLIFGAITKLSKKWQVQVLLVAVVGAIGWALGHYEVFVPCDVDLGMTELPFFYFGYLLKRTPILYTNKYDRYNIVFALVLIGIALSIYYLCGRRVPKMSVNVLPRPWVVIMCGCASFVVAALLICKIIKRIPVVNYVGRYSIIVLCAHMLVFVFVANLTDMIGLNFYMSNALFTLLICLGLIPLFVRFLPWFVAQKDLIPMPQTREAG